MMRPCTNCLGVVLAVAAALVCDGTAAAQSSENAKRLQPLELAIGQWREVPGEQKAKRPLKEWRFAWTAHQNALLITQLIEVNGKAAGQLDALFGWDKANEQISGSGVGSGGIRGGGWLLTPEEKSFTITAGAAEWVFTLSGTQTPVVTSGPQSRKEFRKVRPADGKEQKPEK